MHDLEAGISGLLEQARDGDGQATNELLALHRERLCRMVAVRMDPRLAARFDPSDVVQETFAEAYHRLPDYLERRSLPFYPWLRQIAWQRLVQLHREHVLRQKRSIAREANRAMMLSDGSVAQLAGQIAADGTSPSGRLVRQELIVRVRAALEELSEQDREVLTLRHLEQLSVRETAEILGISRTAVTTRHFRAIDRLHELLQSVEGAADAEG